MLTLTFEHYLSKELELLVGRSIAEIPMMIIAYLIIDREMFGRKRTIILFFIITAFLNFCAYLNMFLMFSYVASRFCFGAVSSIIYAYTTEAQKTSYRTIGIGWASSMGTVGSFLI